MNFKFKREMICRFRTEASRNISPGKCGTLFVSSSESSLNAVAKGLSVTRQDDVSPAPVCNRSHHCLDNVVIDCLARKTCKYRARDAIHCADVRRSLLPSSTVAEEAEVERYDVVPLLLRIFSPLSPVRIFLCS